MPVRIRSRGPKYFLKGESVIIARATPGTVFGRLTVLSLGHMKHGKKAAMVKCTCGTEKILEVSSLESGLTKSCGCLRKETTAALARSRTKQ